MNRIALPFLLLIIVVSGCVHDHTETGQPEKNIVKKTVWTQKTELFMEMEEPAPGVASKVLVHLTELRSFKPISEGALLLTFKPQAGEPVTIRIDAPVRPGIYTAEVTLPGPGEYTLTADLKGKTVQDRIVVGELDILTGHDGHGEEHQEPRGGPEISFLKEQQWTVDFMVARPARRTISSTFAAPGELIPAAHAEVSVSVPLSGVVSTDRRLPYAGRKVAKGEVLALVEQPVNQQGGLGQLNASHVEAKSRLILAQREYERALRLFEAKAVPKRRLEEAELARENAQMAVAPFELAVRALEGSMAGNKFAVLAPISGTVVELMTSNGKAVEAGQPLLRIINTSTLWLRANIPATEIGRLKNFPTATFTIPGIEGALRPRRLVAINDVVDPRTRTVPVIFEVGNAGGRLKVGMFADVSIKTGSAKNALTVPEDALFEDEGRYFIFIQNGGESFERREVSVGIRESGHAQITGEIGEVERVVIKGGYYVKLASLSSRMPDAHAGHGH